MKNWKLEVRTSLLGYEKSMVIKDGRLARGIWQEIFLAEFDGPRERKVGPKGRVDYLETQERWGCGR
ncbi:MAG: YjbQ family protein [Patescibacteria group bacterium]